MMEVSFRLVESVQRERATAIQRRGGLHNMRAHQGEHVVWAGTLLGHMAEDMPSQYLSLIDKTVVVYKGTRQTLFQNGGGAILAYIASGVDEFCYDGISLYPKKLTDEMRNYLPLLVVKNYKPDDERLLWYEARPLKENRFEGLTGW